jgi:predicted RNase H-like HicB family nuclease
VRRAHDVAERFAGEHVEILNSLDGGLQYLEQSADASKFDANIRRMQKPHRMTAIIEREDDGFVAICPEMDIASQGASIEEARANLVEALTLFFETADVSEVSRRLHSEFFVTQRGKRHAQHHAS